MTPKEIAALLPLNQEHKTWLEDIRKEVFKRALVASYGNQSEAARLLQVHRNTLRTTTGRKP